MDQLPGVLESADLNVSQRQVVAVIVGGGIDLLSLFEEGRGVGDFAGANIGFAEVVIRVEVARVELDRFLELLGGEIEFSQVAGAEPGFRCTAFWRCCVALASWDCAA